MSHSHWMSMKISVKFTLSQRFCDSVWQRIKINDCLLCVRQISSRSETTPPPPTIPTPPPASVPPRFQTPGSQISVLVFTVITCQKSDLSPACTITVCGRICSTHHHSPLFSGGFHLHVQPCIVSAYNTKSF